MAVFKCKMCGGELAVTDGSKICECEYCGTRQTVSVTNDDKLINKLNRANYFRQSCEFERALQLYENLVEENKDDCEIYWQLVLCRYGIEYVDDPLTRKKIPTCHRTQFKSILDDADYLSALKYASPEQKEIYINEAEYIDKIQKGILEIVHKEKPFDVFICYKESSNGERTKDSVIAQDIYSRLTQEGFKVFFSRITLEDKLGQEYEPYIFAALQSSKVMLVVGTCSDNFNAVWVKNEWTRFMSFMNNDKSKVIIPVYKDMSPYDMPDDLAVFQAQDMAKIGAVQDLIHGISKIVKPQKTEARADGMVILNQRDNLIKRGNIALSEKNWKEASESFNKSLDVDATAAYAYAGLLMVEKRVTSLEALTDMGKSLRESIHFKHAYQYGSDDLKKKLDGIAEKAEYNENLTKYKICMETLERAVTQDDYSVVIKAFESMGDFEDSKKHLNEAKAKLRSMREQENEEKYNKAVELAGEHKFDNAIIILETIIDYKDSKELIAKIKAEKNEYTYLKGAEIYEKADSKIKYEQALKFFEKIKDYKNSKEIIEDCKYRINYYIEDIEYQKIVESLKNDDFLSMGSVSANNKLTDYIKKLSSLKYHSLKQKQEYITICQDKIRNFDSDYKKREDKLNRDRKKALNKKKPIMKRFPLNIVVIAAIFLAIYAGWLGFREYKGASRISDITSGNLSVGDTVEFGQRKFKNMEWTVLDINGDRVTLISKGAVAAWIGRPFDKKEETNDWSECTLHDWLTNKFYSSTFSFKEKGMLVDCGRSGIEDDKVFILSSAEAKSYFSSESDRAIGQYWWLRSEGITDKDADFVDDEGEIYGGIENVDSDLSRRYGVRPVIVVDISD